MDAGSPTRKIVLDIAKRTEMAHERLKAEFSKVGTKIHRFPRGLLGIGGDNNRYIVPSVVAIGPYHHGFTSLNNFAWGRLYKMEEVKLAAAYRLFRDTGGSTPMEAYKKILSIVGDARGCYDADDPLVANVGDAEFAEMMFLDGCFLLQYMVGETTPALQNRMILSMGPSIQRDIFLLENQIPWAVLQVLREFMPVDVRRFVVGMQEKFNPGKPQEKFHRRVYVGSEADDYTPPHLLGLLWHTQVGSMPEHMKTYWGFLSSLKSSNAAELAEIGVKLAPSAKPWFADMGVRRRPLFGELSLSPVFLNDITACWLVNIAALEATNSGASEESDGYIVSSYLSVLAMLMDREEDVQQLRSNYILYSTFSNMQALRFFKGLAEHLRFSNRYFATLEAIYSYRGHVWIATYRFIYKHYRAIAAVLSIAGVLFSILNALYSLKKPYKT